MKLIDKDAVLAIIEKFMYGANLEADIASTGECFDEKVADAKYQLCKCIKGKLDTLEVKEVDLKAEIDRVWDNTSDNFSEDGWKEFEGIAKHFFELGLNASNSLTWEDMRELHIIFSSLDVDIELSRSKLQKETLGYYEEVLKRFKERKEK